jgi:hypothetical protein
MLEVKKDTAISTIQENMEDMINSIWSELEETMAKRV